MLTLKTSALKTVLVLLVFVLGVSVGTSRKEKELGKLIGTIEQREAQLEADYQAAIKKNKEYQAKQTELKKQQDKAHAKAQKEIDRLNADLLSSTIRVRIKTETDSCGSTGGDKNRSARDSERNTSTENGILSEAATRSLAGAIEEVEIMNSAYRACRAMLVR